MRRLGLLGIVIMAGVFGLKGQDVNAMELEEVCLGRIMLRLPVEREVVTASGRFDDVLVEVIPSAASASSIEAVRAMEIAYLTELARGDTSPVTSEEIGDQTWVARYKTRVDHDAPNAAHGAVIVDGVALRLNSLGDETVIDEVAAAVTRVAQGIHSLGTPSRPAANGFCFPSGHVVAQPYEGFNESANVQYRLENGDLLEVTTRTNNDEVPEGLAEGLEQGASEYQEAFGQPFHYEMVRSVRSSVFGGEAATIGADEETQIFIWSTKGRARDPAQPFIEITLQNRQSEGATQTLLEGIVGSLQRVGDMR